MSPLTFLFKLKRLCSEWYYNLYHLPRNIRKWGLFVLRDRDWDYSYTLKALEIKCRAQARLIGEKGQAVNAKKTAKQILECAEALKRLADDDYVSHWIDENTTMSFVVGNAMKIRKEEYDAIKKDLAIVKKSIGNIHGWWD